MNRFLVWLSGASPHILQRCAVDKARYAGIGGCILVSSFVICVSLIISLNKILLIPLAAAIPIGMAIALILTVLDRSLIVSLPRRDGWLGNVIQAIPGIILGLLIGLVVSTPLVLQTFGPEIQQQIVVTRNQQANTYLEQIISAPLGKEIATERATVAALQSTIVSGEPSGNQPTKDPTLQSLIQQRTQAEKLAQIDYSQWQCELYGVSAGSCSGRTGNGALAKADQERYLQALALISDDDSEIQSVQQQLTANASIQQAAYRRQVENSLQATESSLQTNVNEENKLTTSFLENNNNDSGILIQLDALNSLTAQNSNLNVARWLLFTLFALIGSLPFLVKTLLNLGPENAYEKVLAIEEQLQLQSIREAAIRYQAAEISEMEDAIEKTQHTLADPDTPKAQE